MTLKKRIDAGAFFKLNPEKQLSEIHNALSSTPSGKIAAEISKEGHVFVPAGEQHLKSLKSAAGYHGAESHEDAIKRTVSSFITGKMNSGLVEVTAHTHEGEHGFIVVPKKS